MNDQKIYALMAKTPDIRAVQICDALDAELVDVSTALRSLVDVGDVVKHSGTAPNGQPAQIYNLSETFKKSREGKALMEAAAAAITTQELSPIHSPAADPYEPESHGGSRVDRAIAYIIKQKVVGDDELRIAMGLTKPQYPSSFLTAAIRAGKVHKVDGMWKPGKAVAPAKSSETFNDHAHGLSAKHGPVAQFGPTDQPEERVEPTPAAQAGALIDIPKFLASQQSEQSPAGAEPPPIALPQPASTAEAAFRCGLWSDGVLELQRNGHQVAVLNRGEGEQLVDFMGRMLRQAEKAAA